MMRLELELVPVHYQELDSTQLDSFDAPCSNTDAQAPAQTLETRYLLRGNHGK